MTYALYYWPTIPGRGEFIRLAFEDAGVDYVDVGRQRGAAAVAEMINRGAHFAPPIVETALESVSQVVNILAWLAYPLDLGPSSDRDFRRLVQLQLTLADFVTEIHNVHHPLGPEIYYEDIRDTARQAARAFRHERLPAFLAYFERSLTENPMGHDWIVGDGCTTLDLSLFQVMRGLRYAFPNAMRLMTTPWLDELVHRVAHRPGIRAYLDSDRRLAFNNDGIFRHYPELDEQV